MSKLSLSVKYLGNAVDGSDKFLEKAENIRFVGVYPGGLYESFSCFIPCDPTRRIPLAWSQDIYVRNGLDLVWYGLITQITLVTTDRRGIEVSAIGYLAYWNYTAEQRRWIDRRYSSNILGVWEPLIGNSGGESKIDYDQTNQLLFKPKGTWANLDAAYIQYLTYQNSNVKRITFSYDVSIVAEINPNRAKFYDASGASYTANLSAMIDGSSTTSYNIQPDVNDYLYIGFDRADNVSGLRFDLGASVNSNTSAMTLEYYGVDGSWHTVTKTDNTSAGGKSLAQDGTVTFTAFDGWGLISINGASAFYYLRCSWSALTTAVTVNDVYVRRDQAWTAFLYDYTNAATLWQTSVTGTGTQDITLAPSSVYIVFGIKATAGQEVIGTGVYSKITDLVVFGETASGGTCSTVYDLITAIMADLSYTNTSFITPNAYDMTTVGFVSDDNKETILQEVQRLLNYASTNDAYSFGYNEFGQLYYEVQPPLTDYDYILSLSDRELAGVELVLSADFGELFNNIFVSFTTENGKQSVVTHWDDATLDDVTSEGKYFARKYLADAGVSSKAGAIDFGKRILKSKKDLQYYMRSPLQLKGTIRKKDNTRVDVVMIKPGQRIRIADFSSDIGDVLGAGLTFLISRTEYDDDSGVMSVTAGVSDDLAQYLARRDVLNRTGNQ